MTPRCRRTRPQGGAALLAAMLTVTLVATLAASALWQQWRDVEIETSERARVQAGWMLGGALDWSRLILQEDSNAVRKSGGQQTDNLSEPWAVPLQEARLSSFLAADQNNTGDASDADDVFLSGAISDAQAMFNLRNLVSDKNEQDAHWLNVLVLLFNNLNLPEQEARLIARGMVSALVGDAADAPLMPERLQELTWFGVSTATIEALKPYATILPTRGTAINLNTAPVPVLAAVLGTTMSVGQRLATARTNAPFKEAQEALKIAGVEQTDADLLASIGVTTHYFEVRGRLRLQQAVVEEHSLVERTDVSVNGRASVAIKWRERAALGLQSLPAVAR